MSRLAFKMVEEVCVVPFRTDNGRPEFCLVSVRDDSRWDFPRAPALPDELRHVTALRTALEIAGVECKLELPGPLDQFAASKVGPAQTITAFLLRAETENGDQSAATGYRKRWCFPEEARVRIRRKPIRRFIDLAVRQLQG
ncbi:MAG: hypothetical protein CMJ81_21630 [Planctomycetaceae bacterium]|jgi:hypothetical protein|nr:hypothetical protein [Planctomycetaceae bacterium]